MPELPDIELYLDALRPRLIGRPLESIQFRSPFFLRTIFPEIELCEGLRVVAFDRLGKRIVWELEDETFLVFHLMIAGRFQWKRLGAGARNKNDLAAFRFPEGTLVVTEAAKEKRVSLHVVAGRDRLSAYDPGGLEPLECAFEQFRERLTRENRTLKRALTDPSLFSGIGNAYSDEILHAARLSPFQWTQKLKDDQIQTLFDSVVGTLETWVARLKEQAKDIFPAKVTAFRPEMAVHGKYGLPCPVCQTTIQRVLLAINEMNYCPRCQTGGKVLADRSLSKLLKDDWPSTIEEWERTQPR